MVKVATKSKKKKSTSTTSSAKKKKKSLTSAEYAEILSVIERAVKMRSKAEKEKKLNIVKEIDAALKEIGSIECTGNHRYTWPDAPQVKLNGNVLSKTLTPGWGNAAKKGDSLKVKYKGFLYENGHKFDAGTIKFNLGAGDVIRGWDIGLERMKVNEKRRLKIPSDLAYGAQGAPPDIPPDAALLFDIELLAIS